MYKLNKQDAVLHLSGSISALTEQDNIWKYKTDAVFSPPFLSIQIYSVYSNHKETEKEDVSLQKHSRHSKRLRKCVSSWIVIVWNMSEILGKAARNRNFTQSHVSKEFAVWGQGDEAEL